MSKASITTQPFPSSRKVYVQSKRQDVRVPMREISLTATRTNGATEENQPFLIYDTSGAYTDPQASIDIRRGLAALRSPWILERADVEELPAVSSEYGRLRAADPKLNDLRFAHLRKPLRAKPGKNVTQLHYARKGIITPEMEFIALRENLRREEASVAGGHGNGQAKKNGALANRLSSQHPGNSWGASIPAVITAEFVQR